MGQKRNSADIEFQELNVNSVLLDWCPDSKCLVVTDTTGQGRPDGLFVVSIETGEKQPLTSPQPPVLADTNPAVAPDGRSLLFIRRKTWAIGDLHVLPLTQHMTAAGEARPIRLSRLNPDGVIVVAGQQRDHFFGGCVVGTSGFVESVSKTAGHAVRLPFVGDDGVMPAISHAQAGKSVAAGLRPQLHR